MPNVLSSTKGFENALPFDLKDKKDADICKQLAEKVKSYYYKNETPSKDNIKCYINVIIYKT